MLTDRFRLVAINSISLVFALIANIALLFSMARRAPFALSQSIIIIGWYLSAVLLIALVVVASTSAFRLQPSENYALSQAYYYGVIAACLYFIIASLMVGTAYGAYKGHYAKQFRLTSSQRTLMLQTIGFMFYLLLGALVFSIVEGWSFLDSVFWADFTLLTVGIGGEFVPTTHTGRSLLFPYAIGGLVMVGLVIGSVRSLILEHGKEKMSARFMEVKRQEVLASVDKVSKTIRLGPFETIKFDQEGLSESQRREQEFRIMRRIQELSGRKRRYMALAVSTAAALLLWFLGAVVFMHSEKPQGWSYFVSMYFAYTSLLTIGYGDYVVQSNSGKAFFVFWSLLAVPTLTILISNMGETIIKEFKDFTIWIGSLTVLPDEQGLGSALRLGMKRISMGKMYKGESKGHDSNGSHSGASNQFALDRIEKHIEHEELEEEKEADKHGNMLERDVRFYHFILAKEICHLLKDINASPPREYTYDEWNYYLRLIGQDENDASRHRQPRVKHQHGKDDSPDLGIADDEGKFEWSWLGIRSPLMGNQNDAQWLLRRLTTTMESEMRKMSSAKKRREPPPFSLNDLRRRERGQKSDESQASSGEVGCA